MKIEQNILTVFNSLKYLISNVNRVIEYYSGRNMNAPIQKIVIIGDGADVLGMDLLFANETSLPTERLTELKNVESYNRIKLSTSTLKQFMANIGAALEPIHLQPKSMDKTGKKGESSAVNILPFVAGFAGLAVVAAAVAIIPMIRYGVKKSERTDLKNDIEKLEPVEKVYDKMYAAKDKVTDIKAFNTTTINNTQATPDLISYLEEILPADAKISTMSVAEGVVTINGINMAEYEVAGFINDLEKNDHIFGVTTTGYTKDYETNFVKFDASFYIVTDEFIDTLGENADVAAALIGQEAK